MYQRSGDLPGTGYITESAETAGRREKSSGRHAGIYASRTCAIEPITSLFPIRPAPKRYRQPPRGHGKRDG
ncbi:hypothetical protein BC827DRAFT_511474 [Russula dissimulans]|nr:hypothetical protein BC827DRAFT_511474 [Russula dissimulans]